MANVSNSRIARHPWVLNNINQYASKFYDSDQEELVKRITAGKEEYDFFEKHYWAEAPELIGKLPKNWTTPITTINYKTELFVVHLIFPNQLMVPDSRRHYSLSQELVLKTFGDKWGLNPNWSTSAKDVLNEFNELKYFLSTLLKLRKIR